MNTADRGTRSANAQEFYDRESKGSHQQQCCLCSLDFISISEKEFIYSLNTCVIFFVYFDFFIAVYKGRCG